MSEPAKSGAALIEEINQTITATPTLWWLGHAGFVIRFANITFYVDPCFSDPANSRRLVPPPLEPEQIKHADLILTTHAHPRHMDPATIGPMMAASRSARLVLPKSAADLANSCGIPYERMTTTDADLRIEYFKDNLYGRVYAAPSAHPSLDWTAPGGYPYLGYLIRFGRWTVYHAGDGCMYDTLVDRLRRYNVNVAILPIGGRNFSVSDAAQLAGQIGASWIIPMHYGTFAPDCGEEAAFISHMLGHHPEQQFKVFQVGEKWTVPEE